MSAILYICIMATIKFLIQSENDNTNIFVRFINGRTFDLKAKTGYFINADLWDKKTGYPKTGLKHAIKKELCNSIQTDLNALQSDIEKVFNYLIKRLNDSEYKVIQHRYLEGYVKDYGQIGQMLNLSRESARQLEKKALDKIKNQYARIQMG